MIGLFLVVGFIASVMSHDYPSHNRGYPPCTTAIFRENGLIDIAAMLYNCSANMQSPNSNPSYYPYDVNTTANFTGVYAPLNVSVGIALNSMVLVEDVTTQVKISFWYVYNCVYIFFSRFVSHIVLLLAGTETSGTIRAGICLNCGNI